MEPSPSWQAQTDTYLNGLNVRICGNDYTGAGLNHQLVRNLFASPNPPTNPDPRPVFVAINCISNSPSRQYREVLLKAFYNGGGAIDFSADIANWRNIIDAVQAPPPRITDLRLVTNTVRFTIPGQRGRINRVEYSSNFVNWATLTNVTGTNAPVTVRDTNVLANPRRFYRIVRP